MSNVILFENVTILFNLVWLCLLLFGAVFTLNNLQRFRRASYIVQESTAIVPCYIPNEKDIIAHTIDSLSSTEGISNIILVYNGPCDSHTRLVLDMIKSKHLNCHILKCDTSTSRAENLNFALQNCVNLMDTILICDADNIPHRNCVRLLQKQLQCSNASAIQGIVYVKGNSFIAKVTSGYAFFWGILILPMFEILAGSCLYVGSCALWHRDTLLKLQFQKRFSDDIDLTLRTIKEKPKIASLPCALMHELAPQNWNAFFAQRKRWVWGFEQSFYEHICIISQHPRILFILIYHYGTYVALCMGIANIVLMSVFPHDMNMVTMASLISTVGVLILLCIISIYILKQIHCLKSQLFSCICGVLTSPILIALYMYLSIYAFFGFHCTSRLSIQTATIRAKSDSGKSTSTNEFHDAYSHTSPTLSYHSSSHQSPPCKTTQAD